ncbi:hypothetical protein OQA88_11999 [Cercophora sp. LCS_1]
MGIKGIYQEIGTGQRVSLCKLATEHLEQTQRPLRLAIDISIWQFQIQAAKGGSNPANRTLFYRLARLLGHAIQPVFVFDGPNKPAIKRNKRSGRGDGARVSDAMAKRMIRLFGFIVHAAPGEAEAECALLQQQGIVDAVLSEDVDTIMFGCSKTLRNWSGEGKSAKTPTHVTLYDAAEVATGKSGLDREGMVLVALMSGGDYNTEGIPGCGIKVACEAARAGFGRELCQIKRSDKNALTAWKEKLKWELQTNESQYFRTKHKALAIPEDFPDMGVLRLYTHPVVSQSEKLERVRQELDKPKKVDIVGLRELTGETFDWVYKTGAIKFIRVIAPSLLVHQLVRRSALPETQQDDLGLKQKEEARLVKSISKQRIHFSTDATPEFRVSFIPNDIVNIDLDAEPEEQVETFGREGLALNSDDDFEEEVDELDNDDPKSGKKKKPYNPVEANPIWVPTSIVKMGVPLIACDWDDKQRAKVAKGAAKGAAKATRATRTKKTDMPIGALDKYVRVAKTTASTKQTGPFDLSPSSPLPSSLPPLAQEPTLPRLSRQTTKAPKPSTGTSKQTKKPASSKTKAVKKAPATTNPWTIASLQASLRSSRTNVPPPPPQSRYNAALEPILISSSPAGPPPASPIDSAVSSVHSTPTKRSGAQSPPLRGPSPEPLASPTPTKNADIDVQPKRRARPFKRVKSGAEEDTTTQTSTEIDAPTTTKPAKASTTSRITAARAFAAVSTKQAQTSIKTFGRVGRAAVIQAAKDPSIEILSETEDDQSSANTEAQEASRSSTNSIAMAASKSPTPTGLRGGGDIITDDPFTDASSPPTRGRSTTPLSPPKPKGKPLIPHDFDVFCDTPVTKDPKGTTKLFDLSSGFFGVTEVSREEADRVTKGRAADLRTNRRVWRQSEIKIIDLTEDD